MFTPFRFRPSFYKFKRQRPVNVTPICFAVAYETGDGARESVTLLRPAVEKLIEFGRTLDLYCVPMIALHGVGRLDSVRVERLLKELHVILAKADDSLIRDAVSSLIPLAERIAQDPKLSLLMTPAQ